MKPNYPGVNKELEFLKGHSSPLSLWNNIHFSVELFPFRKIETIHNSSVREIFACAIGDSKELAKKSYAVLLRGTFNNLLL